MPRYWFNVRDGNDLLLDDAGGCELPDLKAVKEDAALCARQILSAATLIGVAASLRVQIEVVDEAGETVGNATGNESQT